MRRSRRAAAWAFAIGVLFALCGSEQSLARPSPCAAVRNVALPSDEFGLAIVQRQILSCARHLQMYSFGREDKQQCVTFANALMNILRPAWRNRVVGQARPHSAGNFVDALRVRRLLFARNPSTGLPANPSDLRSRPAFVWWDKFDKPDGHVGVYIGGGLFVDSYVAYELAQLSNDEMAEISDPSRWTWSVRPGPQRRVPWPEGHWPRERVNDGFSVVRVRGA